MAGAEWKLALIFRVRKHALAFSLGASLMFLWSCRKADDPPVRFDLPPHVVMQDRTFRSAALGADVTYRVIQPAAIQTGERIHVVYLLHGYGNNFRDWSTYTSVAQLALRGYVLVMPDGNSSQYMNSATKPNARYEDFITHDLIIDAERGLPQPLDRSKRSIVGISMGGFGAIVLSLKHPDLYGFAGALSPAVDVTRRSFTLRRLTLSLQLRSIFGPEGSPMRSANDPFVLAKATSPGAAPFFFLAVGGQEALREPVQRFEALLQAEHIPHDFHMEDGRHDWQQWNRALPPLIESLESKH